MTTASLQTLAAAVRAGGPTPTVLGASGDLLRIRVSAPRIGARYTLQCGGVVEVVGFDGGEATALPLSPTRSPRAGDPLIPESESPRLYAGPAAKGRVLDPLGNPMDGGAPLPPPNWAQRRPAPAPLSRRPVDTQLCTGVRVLDALVPLGRGQRLAIEAGPGVGKSTLLAQIAAQAEADVVVVALVGERGREVGAFLRKLSPQTRARTVVVVAAADAPPLSWLCAAQTATAIAEWFRADGGDALLLLDSLTRVARAARSVGVAAGEPTTRRGFPVSLDRVIAGLLERTGNDAVGTLTALYTVLVEGDDALADPVAETARALLDGHWVLDRKLADGGRFPAVAPTRSISRCAPQLQTATAAQAATTLRGWLAALDRRADEIAVGVYQPGAELDVDAGLARRGRIDAFLRQGASEATALGETMARLSALIR